MSKRFLSVLGVVAAAATFAVAPASASDEPAPPPQPLTTPAVCVDKTAPVSRLKTGWQGGFKQGVLRGIAIDQGCGPAGTGKVAKVKVSIKRKVGDRCQHLLANGRLGAATKCHNAWLSAKGTGRWSFHLKHRLPKGTYVVSTQAIDNAGNVQAS